jgi:tetratricopeptide (TPR) repeat protein
VGQVAAGDEAARAEALNADVLVYGVLRQEDGERWQLEPQFYLSPDAEAARTVEELTGIHALGRSLDYRRDPASQRDVTEALRVRLEALAQMIIGLSYRAWGDQEGYRRSAETLAAVTQSSDWAQQDNDTGQEILYLFLGNAYLSSAYALGDAAPERPRLLIQARDAFSTAVTLNPDYARSLNGLGNAYFQLARPSNEMGQCDWQWEVLEQAGAAFQAALDAPAAAKPASGYVDYRAHFGLGRYAFYRSACGIDSAQADVARVHYQTALDEFSQMVHPAAQLTLTAGLAHTDLGTMDLFMGLALRQLSDESESARGERMLAAAVAHYAQALTLSRGSGLAEGRKHVHGFMPWYLFALCTTGQGKTAADVLDDTLRNEPDADEARAAIIAAYESNGANWEECTDAKAQ